MSFEGYVQYLTDKGHYFTLDALSGTCPEDHVGRILPGERVVWENIVDQTNGTYDEEGERIDGFVNLEVETIDKKNECRHCGRSDETTVYKIPPDGFGRRVGPTSSS
jgi:hypothetical protein